MVWDFAACKSDLMNDQGLIRQVVAAVLSYLLPVCTEMKTALANNELDEIQRLAHYLRGAAKQLYFVDLANSTERVEQAIRLGEDCDQPVHQVCQDATKLHQRLIDFVNRAE